MSVIPTNDLRAPRNNRQEGALPCRPHLAAMFLLSGGVDNGHSGTFRLPTVRQ
jgi:hypothetical protein